MPLPRRGLVLQPGTADGYDEMGACLVAAMLTYVRYPCVHGFVLHGVRLHNEEGHARLRTQSQEGDGTQLPGLAGS